MKKLGALITILVSILSSILLADCQTNKSVLHLKVIHRGIYNLDNVEGYLFINVQALLSNDGSSDYDFHTYDCTPSASIVTESPEVMVCENFCSGNSIRIYTIRPGQALSIQLMFKVNRYCTLINKPIKIGIIDAIHYKDLEYPDVIIKRREGKLTIFWSEPFELKGVGGTPIDIVCKSIGDSNQ